MDLWAISAVGDVKVQPRQRASEGPMRNPRRVLFPNPGLPSQWPLQGRETSHHGAMQVSKRQPKNQACRCVLQA